MFVLLLLPTPRPPTPTLFPYTTLFRSLPLAPCEASVIHVCDELADPGPVGIQLALRLLAALGSTVTQVLDAHRSLVLLHPNLGGVRVPGRHCRTVAVIVRPKDCGAVLVDGDRKSVV